MVFQYEFEAETVEDVTADAQERLAKLRMLRYLSQPPLPFLPENGAA